LCADIGVIENQAKDTLLMALGSMMAKYVGNLLELMLPLPLFFFHCLNILEFCLQGSGHNFAADVWHPSHGYVNNCDGARSHWACDYRQQ
jgi:hypothetical protein